MTQLQDIFPRSTTRLLLGFVAALFLAGVILLNQPARANVISSPPDAGARPELVLQTGHTLRVNCIVFAPDGKWLASGGADNSIKIWDTSTGRELRALSGHTGWINALAVRVGGDLLASGSNDHSVRLWNVVTGEAVKNLAGHTAAIQSVVFSSDGRLLASGAADNSIKVWEVATGREVRTLNGHVGAITSLAFSGDGKFLASGGADHVIKLWETSSWSERSSLKKHTQKINQLLFSADNKQLFSGGADGLVCLWRIGDEHERFAKSHSSAAVLALQLNREMLISSSADGTLVEWDAASGKERLVKKFATETDSLTSAMFSPDSNLIAITTGNRTVSLVNAANGKLARTLESRSTGLYAVAASGDGKWLASGANDRSVRLWQTSTGREMPRLSGSTGWITSIAFNPSDTLLASGSISGEVKVWNVHNGREAFKLKTDNASINSVVFSNDDKWLAAGDVPGKIQLWDLNTSVARTLSGHEAEVTSLSFSSSDNLLASGSTDKTVRLWDPVSGNSTKTVATFPDHVNSVRFSPDGKLLAVGCADKKITLWEMPVGQLVRTLSGNDGEILTLAFSPDGRTIASGSSDHTTRLWDVETGHELRTVVRSNSAMNSVSFTNDGSWLIAGDDDGSMTIANPATGESVVTLVSMRESDDWLAVTPDGLFDGSPSAWGLLLWRFAGSTFSVSPVESFFNEFYYPGLLAEILAGKNPRPVRDITQKDRRQPQINLTIAADTSAPITKRTINLKLDVAEAAGENDHQQGSGARDLRLFRNGLLVKVWSGDVLGQTSQQTFEAEVPVVAGENRFSAYAFNRDNVKSTDVSLTVTGAAALKRSGTAYVLTIGVGRYENPQYNLNYSVADAQAIGEQWTEQQQILGLYSSTVVIPLLNEESTKANILLALQRLAGTSTGPLAAGAPSVFSKIKVAQPEDAVIVYFSGHGTAQGDRFYLIPHDLGYTGLRAQLNAEGLQAIISHSVSDLELEEALKPMDVEQLLLVIDACNSGQALEAEEKRRGPMNTRGLAQLAYEKGMYVLTASQSVEVAFESEALKHSYLAYALVEEGMKSGAADSDRDGQVVLDEWFDYATERVPRMGKDKRAGSKELIEVDADERRVQRPRAFYAARMGNQKLIVARVHSAGVGH